MALKDVKQYYYDMQAQLIAAKNDLADFESALADGYITEDKLEAIKDELATMQINYDRLTYIMYLFGLPNRPKKKKRYNSITSNAAVKHALEKRNATKEQVIDENYNCLALIRQEIKELKEQISKK